MSTKRQRSKNIRKREVEEKYRPRLHRAVGAYLALRAWTHDLDCLVLSRTELLKFFDMDATPDQRMERIKKDIRRWFRGFVPSRRPNSPTYVNYLFLLRREEDVSRIPSNPELSPNGIKLLVKKLNESGGPKAGLFSQVANDGEVPSQKSLLSELVLVVTGLEQPALVGGPVKQHQGLKTSAPLQSPSPSALRPIIFKKV